MLGLIFKICHSVSHAETDTLPLIRMYNNLNEKGLDYLVWKSFLYAFVLNFVFVLLLVQKAYILGGYGDIGFHLSHMHKMQLLSMSFLLLDGERSVFLSSYMNVMFLHAVLLTPDDSLYHMCMYHNMHVVVSISRSDPIQDLKYLIFLSMCDFQHLLERKECCLYALFAA